MDRKAVNHNLICSMDKWSKTDKLGLSVFFNNHKVNVNDLELMVKKSTLALKTEFPTFKTSSRYFFNLI